MTDRIPPRHYKLGTSDGHDPEKIEVLRDRLDKHERLTRGKPARAFGEILKDRMRGKPDEEESEEEEEEQEQGAKDPLLGLDPNQKPGIANKSEGRRTGMVIVKG